MARRKPHKIKRYIDFIHNFPCCVTGESYNVVAHHIRMNGTGGMGMKPADWFCVPLTDAKHKELHNHGERTFWDKYDVDPWREVEALTLQFWDEVCSLGVADGDEVASFYRTMVNNRLLPGLELHHLPIELQQLILRHVGV